MKRPRCAHCLHRVATRPRGLCWGCHTNRTVRALYRIHSPTGHGAALSVGEKPLPDAPTDAAPGTAAKVAVLRARAKAGVQLHHPGDARDLEGHTGRDALGWEPPPPPRPVGPACSNCRKPLVMPNGGYRMCPACRERVLACYYARKARAS